MIRLVPATQATGPVRRVVGVGAAVVVLALAASGCVSSGPASAPTPDPYVGLADRSDQAFREGLEAYGQGQYRDALAAFDRARVLSPTGDARIDQMLERTRAAMAPTATQVPPTATTVPATATPVPVLPSVQQPDADLGQRYFGKVVLGVVPGTADAAPQAAQQFFFQDQIALSIEGLKQHPRLPLSLRVFDTESKSLLAEIRTDDTTDAGEAAGAAGAGAAASPTVAPRIVIARGGMPVVVRTAENASATPGATPGATAGATSAPAAAPKLTHFFDTYLWYHQGGEAPGRYHLELYANGTLTHTFDYTVETTPRPTATPVPTLAPKPALPVDPTPPPLPPAAPVLEPKLAAAVAQAERLVPTATPEPTPPPTPTAVPTPANAYTTMVGGIAAGLDVDPNTGRFFMADASGVVWSTDASSGNQRATLGTPFKLPASFTPVDLAVDPAENRVYVAARASRNPDQCPAAASTAAWPGCIVVLANNGDTAAPSLLASIPLTSRPGDMRLNADRGLLYVVLPDQKAIGLVDVRAGKQVGTIDNLPQITGIALDPYRGALYAAHLTGQLSVIDTSSQQVSGRVTLTGAGLSGVATARGLAYGINTATHELAVVEPIAQGVIRYPLSQEPAAVTASESSGAVFVLSSRSNAIVRLDPTSGTEVGRVLLANRSGQSASQPTDLQALRPRFALNQSNESVYATLPEAGTLAAVNIDTFPALAQAIPYVQAPDQPVVASIEPLLRPANSPLPSDSSTLRAQPSAPADED